MKHPALVLSALLLGACRDSVPIDRLLLVETELAEQAGTSDADTLLLDAMEAHARQPVHRAEIARRRCALLHASRGPLEALPACRAARTAGADAGGIHLLRAQRRLALALAGASQGGEALTLLRGLSGPSPLERGLTGWARTEALRSVRDKAGASREAELARTEIVDAVRVDEKLTEYLAVADWQLGRALAEEGEISRAREVLSRAWLRQVVLDRSNGEYAEYRLYLARIQSERARLPGGEGERDSARALRSSLLDRDPTRWEYLTIPQ